MHSRASYQIFATIEQFDGMEVPSYSSICSERCATPGLSFLKIDLWPSLFSKGRGIWWHLHIYLPKGAGGFHRSTSRKRHSMYGIFFLSANDGLWPPSSSSVSSVTFVSISCCARLWMWGLRTMAKRNVCNAALVCVWVWSIFWLGGEGDFTHRFYSSWCLRNIQHQLEWKVYIRYLPRYIIVPMLLTTSTVSCSSLHSSALDSPSISSSIFDISDGLYVPDI